MSSKIVGSFFLGKETVAFVNAMTEGDIVVLSRDKENEHDPNAIKVSIDVDLVDSVERFHLGYIPAEHSKILAPVFDEEGITETAAVYKGKKIIKLCNSKLDNLLQAEDK